MDTTRSPARRQLALSTRATGRGLSCRSAAAFVLCARAGSASCCSSRRHPWDSLLHEGSVAARRGSAGRLLRALSSPPVLRISRGWSRTSRAPTHGSCNLADILTSPKVCMLSSAPAKRHAGFMANLFYRVVLTGVNITGAHGSHHVTWRRTLNENSQLRKSNAQCWQGQVSLNVLWRH